MPGLWGIREWQLEDLLPRGTNRSRTDPPPTPGPCGVALTRAGGAALYHGRSPGGDLRARRDCVDGVLGPIPTSWRAGRRGGFIPCKPLKSGVGTSPTQTEACFDNLEMGPAGCLSNMYRFCALLVFWRYWGGDEAMRFLDVYSDIDDGLRKSDPERYISELLAEVGKCWRWPGAQNIITPPSFRPVRTGRTRLPFGGSSFG